MYHRVVAERDPLAPDEVCAVEFDSQMSALARWFTVLPLPDAVGRLRNGALPVRAACVTFDDGYADNDTVALPILRKHGVPATFFVSSGFVDGGRMWNDTVIEAIRRAAGSTLDARCIGLDRLDMSSTSSRILAIDTALKALKYLPPEERHRRVEALAAEVSRPLPDDLMMTEDQVRHLRASGMEIGAHTATHPILAQIDENRARAEIEGGKRRLEEIIAAPVKLFAYPNGAPVRDYRKEHVEMVKALGFEAAVSTALGVAHVGSDPFQLPRFAPWDKTPAKFALRLLQNTFRANELRV